MPSWAVMLLDSFKSLGVIPGSCSDRVLSVLSFWEDFLSLTFVLQWRLFYRSYIESILTFCIVASNGNLNLSNENRLGSLIKVASEVSGLTRAQLMDVYNKQVLRMANVIFPLLWSPPAEGAWAFRLPATASGRRRGGLRHKGCPFSVAIDRK